MGNIYFVRHGETDWNIKKLIQGSQDTELNDTGLQQAKELSLRLKEKNYTFDAIYSSFQKRAVKTAEIISRETDMDYLVVEGLEEINLGKWEGLNWQQVKEQYPKEFNEWFYNRRYQKAPPW